MNRKKCEVENEAVHWRFQSPDFTIWKCSGTALSFEFGCCGNAPASLIAKQQQNSSSQFSDLPPDWHTHTGNCGHFSSHKKGSHRRPQTRQTFSFSQMLMLGVDAVCRV
ncbi:hypothetical protein ILYODFUR_029818 [Ilyodon furcidens]|uniref:Uncharacterized protein n=1 Tax=Ilyodon furcidens TaxID=33524 RepID=A0ABV0TMW4_9TELE